MRLSRLSVQTTGAPQPRRPPLRFQTPSLGGHPLPLGASTVPANSNSSAELATSDPSPSARPSVRRTPSARLDRIDRLRRLTARDHRLLRWLAEHYVLSTDQIATALFPC